MFKSTCKIELCEDKRLYKETKRYYLFGFILIGQSQNCYEFDNYHTLPNGVSLKHFV